tara:strand:+ start:3301 stop:3438 length:138 start_codon:yes stop_codon:yes gene_type:complete
MKIKNNVIQNTNSYIVLGSVKLTSGGKTIILVRKAKNKAIIPEIH